MKPIAIITQVLEVIAALAAAPLFVGWVNQCRAWLQNRRAPSLWLPYRGIRKLFHKDAVIAETRIAPLSRDALHRVLRDGPRRRDHSLDGHRLPLGNAADAIALVGLLRDRSGFLVARRDGHRYRVRHLGARREMMVGFLAEPALLMIIFVASLISATTALPAITENLATQHPELYPSLAFTAVAFTLVLLAENARIPSITRRRTLNSR